MSAHPLLRIDPIDVNSRLYELGLTAEILADAILAGQVARADCTVNDPPSFPGLTAWAVTTRSLREQLMPVGWEKNDDGISTIVNPDYSLAVVVATGDDDTGLPTGNPKTKFPKGPATIAAVQMNQLSFAFVEVPEPQAPTTWVLLIARLAGGVRGELSFPDEIGEDFRIEGWQERIILPNLPGDDGEEFTLPLPEPGPDLDVDVVRIG